jgi:hypothetical protein
MVTPRVDFRHPINTLSAWVSRLRTPSDEIPTAYEVAQRALEAFLGRDGAARVAVAQAARAYEHTTSRRDDPQVHSHALVPLVDGIVDFDGLDTARLTVEIDPDEPWGWPTDDDAAERLVRQDNTLARRQAATCGRLAMDARMAGKDPRGFEREQRFYQRWPERDRGLVREAEHQGRWRGGWSM